MYDNEVRPQVTQCGINIIFLDSKICGDARQVIGSGIESFERILYRVLLRPSRANHAELDKGVTLPLSQEFNSIPKLGWRCSTESDTSTSMCI